MSSQTNADAIWLRVNPDCLMLIDTKIRPIYCEKSQRLSAPGSDKKSLAAKNHGEHAARPRSIDGIWGKHKRWHIGCSSTFYLKS